MSKREGRGWLSSIDKLPKESGEIVLWAAHELQQREREQQDIHLEFNKKLAEINLGPISASAFNRHAMRQASALRRLQDTRSITAVLTDKLEVGQEDDLTIMVAEMIKTLVFELINNGGEAGFSPKQAMEMSNAIKSAAAAQHISTERRRKLEKEIGDKVEKAVEKVTDLVGKEAGLDEDTIAKLRREFLGVKDNSSNGS